MRAYFNTRTTANNPVVSLKCVPFVPYPTAKSTTSWRPQLHPPLVLHIRMRSLHRMKRRIASIPFDVRVE